MKLVDLEGFKFDLSGLAYILPTDWQRIGEYFARQLKERPVVELKPRWIPCSEKHPDNDGLYLVSGGGQIWLCEYMRIGSMRGWSNPANKPCVKAWMPLPEAFKEDNDD